MYLGEGFVQLPGNIKAAYHLGIKTENSDYSFLKKYLVIISAVDIDNQQSVKLVDNLLKEY